MAAHRSLVVIPTDFSKASTATLAAAFAFAERIGATAELVHAAPRPKPLLARSRPNRAAVARIDRDEMDEVRERLRKLAARAPGPVRTRLLRGVPSEAIAAHAEKMGAEFIVMGTAGRTAAGRFFLGSTTDHVLRRTRVPVVVLPVDQ